MSDAAPATGGEIRFAARDGHILTGTLFPARPGTEPPRGIVIGSAMGVPRGFYIRFALYLKTRGFTLLTFDWRGIGAEAGDREARLHQWGEQDLPAAIARLVEATGAPVGYVGHSVGGQMLGLVSDPGQVARALLVAAQLGQPRHWDGWRALGVAAAWRAIPPLTWLFGRLPGWSFGGADVAPGVAREWARWGRHRDYLLSHDPEAAARFARVTAPLLIYSVEHDGMAPPRAVDALAALYSDAPQERRQLPPIGHFGFFDRRHADTLWREAADWLATPAAPR